MSEFGLLNLVVLPVALGLLGFIEPCSLGSTLLFIKYLESKTAVTKLAQAAMFAVTRAVFMGVLGALAVMLGTPFLGLQKLAWILLGLVYSVIGALYIAGRAELLMITLGPRLNRLSDLGGSAALALMFGLNIPACAAPLMFALFGAAAAAGATGATLAAGFISLGLFGLALSLPIVLAVVFEPARLMLDRVAGLSKRLPIWTGLLLLALGLWSIWFGLFVAMDA
jgi:cytochrome c-type biogenesis protein